MGDDAADLPPPAAVTLRWLLRLRWLAVAGQLAAMLFAQFVLGFELPWLPLLGVLMLAAFSNSLLLDTPRRESENRPHLIGLVIGADILLLTALLYLTGGTANPFTSFFLVLVALAAISLSGAWLAGVSSLAVACYAILFYWHRPLHGPDGEGEILCAGYSLHLQGMAVAFLLTSVCIAVFVQRLHRSLRQREQALVLAEARAARADQFSALATLAAGVAHELGSPLGTIAVVSHELTLALENGVSGPSCVDDARLIRQEVERCRSILDRMGRSAPGPGSAAAPVSAATLAAALRAELPAACRERLALRDHSAAATVLLPPAAVLQSLMVLIQNACDADPSGAPVELEIAHTPGRLTLTVSDRGHGLDNTALRHAGEPFFTTKPVREGMGLGLFLARTVAEQLAGNLTLANRPGGGVRACLSLPAPDALP